MQQKNAKQYVQEVNTHLQDAQNCLTQAFNSAEKLENKEQVKKMLDAVGDAIESTVITLANYEE